MRASPRLKMSWLLKVVVPTVGLFAAAPADAQPEHRRAFLGVGRGPSVASGNFVEASTTGTRGGTTTLGYSDTFLVAYRVRQHLALAVAFSFSHYPLHETDVNYDNGWNTTSATAGLVYSIPLSTKAAVDLKAMAGQTGLQQLVADTYTTTGARADGLLFDVRAAFRYDVRPQWVVFAEAGLQTTSSVGFETGVRKNFRAIVSGVGIAFRPAW